ncbi:MAG TPA: alpha/beta hydrolase, partial [Candidatus Limnocylindrales bacterium]|nr:alpha/beta hydrolase [Candidatus Limnocylindrales bacterium]
LRTPERTVKVIVVGSPIQGSSLSPLLKMAASRNWIAVGQSQPVLYNVFQAGFRPFLRGYAHFMAKDGGQLGRMLTDDVAKLALAPFVESITTLRETDLRPELAKLTMPVLGVYGKKDIIVNPNQAQVLKASLPSATVAVFERSGHFPMMDEPERFHLTLRDFLQNG